MLVKKVEQTGKDWDSYLPFVLFVYHDTLQETTKKFLLGARGCDPIAGLPTMLGLDNM